MTVATEAAMAPKQPSGIRTAAVMCIQLMLMGFGVVTSGMAILTEYWSSNPLTTFLPVTLISTLPTLTTIFGILISGALIGKVKPKVLAIIASLIFVVFGVMPFFYYNYAFLLVCRALCGIGLGLMNPIANTIILGCYSGSKKDSLLGYGTLMMNGGSLVFNTLGGVLAGVGTGGRFIFLAHLFGLVALVFAFLLPDPDLYQGEAQEAPAESEDVQDAPKAKIPGSVWFLGIVLALFNVCNYPAMLNCSTILMNSGIDSSTAATVAAMALNCYTIFAMIGGGIFGTIFKKIPQWVIPIGWALCALGAFFIFVVSNVPAIYAGLILIGFGFDIVYPCAFSWCGAVSAPAAYAKGISTIQTMMNVGSFLSTYWLVLCGILFGDAIYAPGYVEILFCAIFAVVFAFYNPWKGKKTEAAAVA